MGAGTFFSKFASMDPLANALHLPGANKYSQQQLSNMNGASAANSGPYGGIAPTLAGANAGYRPGGPGANTSWQTWTPTGLSGLQRIAAGAGSIAPSPYVWQQGGGSAGPNVTKPGQTGNFNG